jgi:hypothetical protein
MAALIAVKKGTAVMKKPPASAPEPLKTPATKTRRTSKTDAATAKQPLKSSSTGKLKRPPRKPLLDFAVDTVKKMF